jgi:hypothetical protein
MDEKSPIRCWRHRLPAKSRDLYQKIHFFKVGNGQYLLAQKAGTKKIPNLREAGQLSSGHCR